MIVLVKEIQEKFHILSVRFQDVMSLRRHQRDLRIDKRPYKAIRHGIVDDDILTADADKGKKKGCYDSCPVLTVCAVKQDGAFRSFNNQSENICKLFFSCPEKKDI